MSKVAHVGVHVSQTSAEMRLFSENLHVVTSRNWYNFVDTPHIGWTSGKLCSKLHIIMDSCVKRCVQTHLFQLRKCVIVRSQRAKQWKLSTQTCPRMSKVAHGRVLESQNGAESYRGQSSWWVVLHGQSFFFVVVVSRFSWSVVLHVYNVCLLRDQLFFVANRLDRRGQSSWSVVLRAQSAFFSVVVVSRFFVVSQSS